MTPMNRIVARVVPGSVPSRSASTARTSALIATMAALSGVATPALAQDANLEVQITPNVLYSGQSADVNVFAHFPSDMYAFAAAQFDVFATEPTWSFASAGAIVGSDVLGINAWQLHAPHAGVYADPANPFRVWRGTFTPSSNAPALVEIMADPTGIAIYPSRFTSSSIPAVPTGTSEWVFVNPLSVGSWVAAPGRGTTAHVSDDVIVDGQIITAENPSAAILIGLLCPAIQKSGTVVNVQFDERPDSFAATVDIRDRPGEQMTLGYTYIEWTAAGEAGAYELTADLGGPNSSPVSYEGFLGGVVVAAGELGADGTRLLVNRVPDEIGADVKPLRGRLQPYRHVKLESALVSSWSTTGHGDAAAQIFLPDGEVIAVDSIRVRATRAVPSNNIHQLGLGVHVLEATGVRSMTIEPRQPR